MQLILLKHGRVVRPQDVSLADMLLRDGKIAKIGLDIPEASAKIIDCSNKVILPGLIDAHVHFRIPGEEHKEDWETGSQAALAGGVTTVLDMPNNVPPIVSRESLKAKEALVSSQARVNYRFYMGAAMDSITGQTNVGEFLDSDAVALKIYMGSSTGSLLMDQSQALEEIFEKVGLTDRLVCVHAEDQGLIEQHAGVHAGNEDPQLHGVIRDVEVAHQAVKRVIHLAKKYNTRLHLCHLSSALELEDFKAFRSDRISCEVTPHHLFLDESELARQGNFAKVNPPLRTSKDNAALMKALRKGIITMVATDHAPHLAEEKQQPYSKAPAGVPGLETHLPLLLNAVHRDELSLLDVVRVTSAEPARVFGLKNKGALEVGMDADVCVVNMDLEQTVANGGPGARYTKSQWSPFTGRLLKGWPIKTFVGGEERYRSLLSQE